MQPSLKKYAAVKITEKPRHHHHKDFKCPPFEWNRQHFSRNPSEKDALTDTRKIVPLLFEILNAVM